MSCKGCTELGNDLVKLAEFLAEVQAELAEAVAERQALRAEVEELRGPAERAETDAEALAAVAAMVERLFYRGAGPLDDSEQMEIREAFWTCGAAGVC